MHSCSDVELICLLSLIPGKGGQGGTSDKCIGPVNFPLPLPLLILLGQLLDDICILDHNFFVTQLTVHQTWRDGDN